MPKKQYPGRPPVKRCDVCAYIWEIEQEHGWKDCIRTLRKRIDQLTFRVNELEREKLRQGMK